MTKSRRYKDKSPRQSKDHGQALVLNKLTSLWTCPTSYEAHYVPMISKLAQDVDSSLAREVLRHLECADYDALLGVKCKPDDYSKSDEFYMDNLIVSLIKKYPLWSLTTDPEQAAIKQFLHCEKVCRGYNDKYENPKAYLRPEDDIAEVLHLARRKISQILSTPPSIAELSVVFGPGSTYAIKRDTSSYEKINGELDVTPEAIPTVLKMLESCPGWISKHLSMNSFTTDLSVRKANVLKLNAAEKLHKVRMHSYLTFMGPHNVEPPVLEIPTAYARLFECLTVVPGCSLAFIDKTALVGRPIMVGASLNVLCQKAYGTIIRNRLKQHGVNLNRNSYDHAEAARKGSIDGSIATIDLTSASDMISYGVVKDMLPSNWLHCLDAVREKHYEIEDNVYKMHKFSSMGNGFTFELESLIFYAIAFAAAKVSEQDSSVVSCHGDDIITPTGSSALTIDALEFCGFSINRDKSFTSGPFRESCGGDYFHGTPVRGFYFKKSVSLADIVRLRNYLYRNGYCFRFKTLWNYISRLLKPYMAVLTGPDDGTDDHIVVNYWGRGRQFNFIHVGNRKRKLPKRFLNRKAWLLYESQFIRNVHPFKDRHQLMTEGSSVSTGIEYVTVSSRYESNFTTEKRKYLVYRYVM